MRFSLLSLFLCLSLGLYADDFLRLFTVSSSIEISSDGKPVLKAGTFSIPPGFQATNLIFKYYDPINNLTMHTITTSNIYNIETNSTLNIEGEIKSIPAGNYQLKITGEVGTCAILIYDLEPEPSQ